MNLIVHCNTYPNLTLYPKVHEPARQAMLTPIQNSGPASHQPQLQQDEHYVVSFVKKKSVSGNYCLQQMLSFLGYISSCSLFR
jgi:hypothetical protein